MRQRRTELDYTQEEVSIVAGVSYNSYRKYERGHIPNLVSGLRILAALQVRDPYAELGVDVAYGFLDPAKLAKKLTLKTIK